MNPNKGVTCCGLCKGLNYLQQPAREKETDLSRKDQTVSSDNTPQQFTSFIILACYLYLLACYKLRFCYVHATLCFFTVWGEKNAYIAFWYLPSCLSHLGSISYSIEEGNVFRFFKKATARRH